MRWVLTSLFPLFKKEQVKRKSTGFEWRSVCLKKGNNNKKKGGKKVENWIATLEPVGPQFPASFILKEQVSEIAQA